LYETYVVGKKKGAKKVEAGVDPFLNQRKHLES